MGENLPVRSTGCTPRTVEKICGGIELFESDTSLQMQWLTFVTDTLYLLELDGQLNWYEK
jgi:hypothetical protein